MEAVIKEIVEAKLANADAFLHLKLNGECTLWDYQPSPGGRGVSVIGLWTLNKSEHDAILDIGLVDCAV
jgi:hypothetical protein